ncbi:hypothetical protein [Halosolutus gelatinilyticus]|uniref:hypothetical protein n=1 Tax=Halosolutus gelatinilyticus TaxID=2931975 RepID=UPI001FF6A9B2|nr:hypothetical protein [Halosolutus gelatinilyticus]
MVSATPHDSDGSLSTALDSLFEPRSSAVHDPTARFTHGGTRIAVDGDGDAAVKRCS